MDSNIRIWNILDPQCPNRVEQDNDSILMYNKLLLDKSKPIDYSVMCVSLTNENMKYWHVCSDPQLSDTYFRICTRSEHLSLFGKLTARLQRLDISSKNDWPTVFLWLHPYFFKSYKHPINLIHRYPFSTFWC